MVMTSADQLERRALAAKKQAPKMPAGVNPMNPYTAPVLAANLKPVNAPVTSNTSPPPVSTASPITTAMSTMLAGQPTASQTPQNVVELRRLYANALAELQRQQGLSGETIAGSIGRMKTDPYNTANAYAQLQAIAPPVAANPIAEYAAATGMSPTAAAAAQNLASAEGQAYQNAVQNLYNTMSASQEAANASRMADIGLIETGAQQDLGTQANMLNLLLKQSELGAVSGLQQRNLENQIALRNALTGQVSNIFAGSDVAPESILKLIEATLAKMNTYRWA